MVDHHRDFNILNDAYKSKNWYANSHMMGTPHFILNPNEKKDL